MGWKLQGIARANSLCIARAVEAWSFEPIEKNLSMSICHLAILRMFARKRHLVTQWVEAL